MQARLTPESRFFQALLTKVGLFRRASAIFEALPESRLSCEPGFWIRALNETKFEMGGYACEARYMFGFRKEYRKMFHIKRELIDQTQLTLKKV